MASDAATALPTRDAVRDPVLLLPLVVAAGLAVGRLGVHGRVAGTRIAADLALSWALIAASLVALERPRWRRTRWLLAATPFALLGADLEWASSPALWTLGFLVEGLWAASLVQVVLTFPEGRPWSRPARIALLAAYTVTLGGQLAGGLVAPDARDLLSVASQPSVAEAIDRAQGIAGVGVALAALFVVVQRVRTLGRPARRAQGPLLLAAAITALAGLVWLGWVIADDARVPTLETIARALALTIPVGIVVGIGWSRLRRPQASELVVELRSEAATTMRERLARALGDPTLDVAYRLGDGRYVDAAGGPVELPQRADRAVTAVSVRGEEIAALVHDPALLDEPALVESVRATAALVLENERLAAEVRSQLAEVRASRGRIVAAADAERRRIERNLHDGAQQRLVTLSVALGLEASRADRATADVLARAQEEVEQAVGELRELARGIHPTLLRDEGLTAAVEALARRTPLPVTVESSARDRLPDAVELAAYFVVSEALTNVVKHASATQASVLLEREPATLHVTVTDDGVGGAHLTPGSGLAGLRDRLEALDATLSIESDAAHGTSVGAVFPCGS
ncbi:MAG TPA: histidine kinase [Gaiellaceae bacterium]|jgi:signal transduction histidine kinase